MNLWNNLYRWACQRLYHELAPAYDLVAWLVSAGQWARWRRLALDELCGDESRVLELGFGTGVLLAEMGQRNIPAVGLELSPAMHQVTQSRLRAQRLGVSRVQASAFDIPLAANSVDAIVSTFPAPYILEPATLAECARVLRPGGRLIVVGLWTRLEDQRLARLLPIFYGAPSDNYLAAIRAKVETFGFTAQATERRVGPVNVGLLLAEYSFSHL